MARLGRVSVRMLRHYDAIGLLHPAHVDDVTGYLSYRASQLARLNRINALKDLVLTLQQVQDILDADGVSPVDPALGYYEHLAHWIDENGYRLDGPEREVTLAFTPGEDGWVTEFQYPVAKA
ncbi:MAG: MerR family transcriptional regulator [Aeromicrobium sp.]